MNESINHLPTRRQKALLDFISNFIEANGYSPSYREIQEGMGYKSTATVSIHVNNLINKGLIIRNSRYARSIEPVDLNSIGSFTSNQIQPNQEKWLVEKVEHLFKEAEGDLNQLAIKDLEALVITLRMLGLDGAAQSFTLRLGNLKNKIA
jgi:SOS-response transcriptional repressor LexA